MGTYEIVCGECRWRAAGLAELQEVPCRIEALTDQEAATAALTENLARKDLNAIDEARGYAMLHEVFNIPQVIIAKKVSVSTSHMSNMIRLLSLPEKTQQLIKAGKIKKGHAKLLVSLPSEEQEEWTMLAQRMSTRDFEKAFKERNKKKNKSKDSPSILKTDPDILRLEIDYSNYIGSPIKFTKKENKYFATIAFHSLDVFEGFLIKTGFLKKEDVFD